MAFAFRAQPKDSRGFSEVVKLFFCSFSDFAHLYKAIHQVLGLAPLRLELLLHRVPRAHLPEQHSWLGTGKDPN